LGPERAKPVTSILGNEGAEAALMFRLRTELR
jgi:hypothetical protein